VLPFGFLLAAPRPPEHKRDLTAEAMAQPFDIKASRSSAKRQRVRSEAADKSDAG
jgi:hypothetical protein